MLHLFCLIKPKTSINMAKTKTKTIGLKPSTAKFLNSFASELNKRANGIVDIKLTNGLDVLATKTTVTELANLISKVSSSPKITKVVSTPKKTRKNRSKRSKTNPVLLNSLYKQLTENKSVNINFGTKKESYKIATALYNKAYFDKVKVSVKRAGKGKGFIVKTA